ncbi:hypothetical protein POJ06DRAFT_249567 [Lipomyces tetrasporus]|uniref:AB hydrolase-1 domain-containing protein n=1 Tax=Lipomyces tetrasporus TaxID=54092 RepID=A0AAD7VUY1_9ASCO|nr:uncharacterized protein POJ06DRAFT_249567 [Lipomyces tetrasporus]KAJ8102386.1 hypothetical protein POJ06DRAFT_249567 [Lipomyces tetrasporus]
MRDSSLYDYIRVRFWIIVLSSIAPLSVLHCGLILAGVLDSYRLPYILEGWALAETIFYFLTLLFRTYYLQSPAIHPPLPSREKRLQLFTRCEESISDHERYISKWFMDTPITNIHKENVKDFLRWAFLNNAAPDSTHEEELDEYLAIFERKLNVELSPGRADNVKCMRLTIDEVKALHRSLVWYMCIIVVDNITFFSMLFHGFHFHHSSPLRCLAVFPPRLQTLISAHRSPVKNFTYYHRPHTARDKLPILLIHGIGVGLYPYVNFLAELNQRRPGEEGDIGIIAIEILQVSSRITEPVLAREEICNQIKSILDHHGLKKVVLLTHSYGSVIASHLLHNPVVFGSIASVVLIDPIIIQLHHADVAYNFVFRKPKSANEWLLWYFGSMDIGVAHTLGRRFFWSENILWKEDFGDRHATIFLAEKDNIVNTEQVRTYLLKSCTKLSNQKMERSHLKVIWCENIHHGHVFDTKVWRKRLIDEVLEHSAQTYHNHKSQ